jgi:hypothetical protein
MIFFPLRNLPGGGQEGGTAAAWKTLELPCWCFLLMSPSAMGGTSRIKDLAHHSFAIRALQL